MLGCVYSSVNHQTSASSDPVPNRAVAAGACFRLRFSITMAGTAARRFPRLLSELDLGFTKLRNRVLMGSSAYTGVVVAVVLRCCQGAQHSQ